MFQLIMMICTEDGKQFNPKPVMQWPSTNVTKATSSHLSPRIECSAPEINGWARHLFVFPKVHSSIIIIFWGTCLFCPHATLPLMFHQVLLGLNCQSLFWAPVLTFPPVRRNHIMSRMILRCLWFCGNCTFQSTQLQEHVNQDGSLIKTVQATKITVCLEMINKAKIIWPHFTK